jgi:uroporphyrinogen-III synthase
MGMARQSEPSPDPSGASRSPVPVLLTRPVDDAKTFAAALRREFGNRVQPVIAPMMAVEHLFPSLPEGPFAGVIFTSSAGVAAACQIGVPQSGLAWCVGRKTAERAAAAGFHTRSADGDAAALVAAIRADPPTGKLLHLRGADSRGEVAETLNSAGIETVEVVVYHQRPHPMSPEGEALLMADGPVILPLFSPRSAALFRAGLQKDLRATLWLVTMSGAVTDAARDIPHRALAEADRPDAPAMLAAIGRVVDLACLP